MVVRLIKLFHAQVVLGANNPKNKGRYRDARAAKKQRSPIRAGQGIFFDEGYKRSPVQSTGWVLKKRIAQQIFTR